MGNDQSRRKGGKGSGRAEGPSDPHGQLSLKTLPFQALRFRENVVKESTCLSRKHCMKTNLTFCFNLKKLLTDKLVIHAWEMADLFLKMNEVSQLLRGK